MKERLDQVRQLGERARPAWTEERAAANELAMIRRGARRRATRRAAGVALGAIMIVAIALGVFRSRAPEPRAGVLRYADGSVATPMSPDAAMRIVLQSEAVVSSELERGSYRFNVVKGTTRRFQVAAGAVHIEVLGTEFAVERFADGRARVSVYSGRVRVVSSEETVELTEGQLAIFPRAALVAPHDAVEPPIRAEPPTSASPARSSTRSWVHLAQAGDYDAAYAAYKRAPAAPQGAAELMLAADAARLSHHAVDALAPLRVVVAKYGTDPRAPLAAFTLGRVLLDDLGQPREAAGAFMRARQLSPKGPLAEDALAREVEAWSRGGEVVRARERAELYLSTYPSGTRTRAVRQFGGMD